jgi:hypothetical protein
VTGLPQQSQIFAGIVFQNDGQIDLVFGHADPEGCCLGFWFDQTFCFKAVRLPSADVARDLHSIANVRKRRFWENDPTYSRQFTVCAIAKHSAIPLHTGRANKAGDYSGRAESMIRIPTSRRLHD